MYNNVLNVVFNKRIFVISFFVIGVNWSWFDFVIKGKVLFIILVLYLKRSFLNVVEIIINFNFWFWCLFIFIFFVFIKNI